MFEKIARFSVRFRWLIIIIWIAAVPLFTSVFPKIGDVSKNNNSDFLPKNSPTQRAAEISGQLRTKGTATGALLVESRDSGPLTPADNAATDRVTQSIKTVKGVTDIADRGLSKDGQARQIFIGIGSEGYGPNGPQVITAIRSKINNLPNGLHLNVTGELAQASDADKANSSSRNKTEIYNVIFIVALLFLVFRAFLAPLATLIPAGLALMVAQPVIAESTKIGVQVSFLTEILLIVLLLGAGTDYGLFLVFRVREELRNGLNPKEAVIKALSRVGESITFSAATVVAALLCLMLASFGLYKGLGPSLAIGLGIMLLAGLTFLPALLAVLGRAVFWPGKTAKTKLKIGLWGRLADRVIEKPVLMLIVGIIVFAGLSLGALGYKTAGFSSSGAPAGSDSMRGQQVLVKHFPAAANNPQDLLMVFNKPVWNQLDKLQKAQTELTASPVFKAISGPFNANGLNLTPAQVAAIHQAGPSNPAYAAVSQFFSADGKIVVFYSIANTGPSGSVEAADYTPAVRAELSQVAKNVGASENAVYGQDEAAYDIIRTSNNDLKRIIPVVLLIIGALLAIMLRSLVAPWYLIITVGLSYLATLGFAMLAFVHLAGKDGLNFVLPFLMFIFLMALGQDYNILVMSRIREEAHKLPLKAAVTKAIGITGTTVTSAGLILAGTFTVFGLASGDSQMQQIGFSVAFGILLDTFFVRTLLVPSIVSLFGQRNWWPSKLRVDSKDSK